MGTRNRMDKWPHFAIKTDLSLDPTRECVR